ncbi:MAG TPA: ATP-binding protein [Labilithrix sp.]
MSEIAARVQRGRSTDAVLSIAGEGVRALGMRLVAFETCGNDLVLRHLATAPARMAAIERRLGRRLRGLRAPIADRVRDVVEGRRVVYRADLDLFDAFLRHVGAFDPSELDRVPDTAGITNGVLAPIWVAERPWGLLSLYSNDLGRADDDADAVALFAMHVGSALEVAASIEALEQAQRDLVKSERLAALGELSAVVAHEIRNPLAVLTGSIARVRTNLHVAARATENEVLLGIAAEETDRLARIVNDLLDFARPNDPRLEDCSLEAVVLDAIAQADAKERVRVDVARDVVVRVDPHHMRRALLNVVQNGLQAASGPLTVRVERDADLARARVDVIDRGPGIPDSLRARVFEPFFTTKASGTGLGLAVVKRIVDAHRGSIDIVSSPTGTTFSILLPLAS